MAERKRYYWLKLKQGFFDEKHVRVLRKLPDGSALVVVYLKLLLVSLRANGLLPYEHIVDSYEAELALLLDEDEGLVRLALEALLSMGIIERRDDDSIVVLEAPTLTARSAIQLKEYVNYEHERRYKTILKCYKVTLNRYYVTPT